MVQHLIESLLKYKQLMTHKNLNFDVDNLGIIRNYK